MSRVLSSRYFRNVLGAMRRVSVPHSFVYLATNMATNPCRRLSRNPNMTPSCPTLRTTIQTPIC